MLVLVILVLKIMYVRFFVCLFVYILPVIFIFDEIIFTSFSFTKNNNAVSIKSFLESHIVL